MSKRVLVTGAAGFIGSHTSWPRSTLQPRWIEGLWSLDHPEWL